MKMRKVLLTAMAGCTFAFAGGAVMAAPDPCLASGTIGNWKAYTGGTGVCQQGDKIWTLGSTNLADNVMVLFSSLTVTHHVMQIAGFDVSDAAGSWFVNYSIVVTNPLNSFISEVHAGVDNPGGGSVLTKVVAGDPGGPFILTDTDGVEGPTAERHGLRAVALNVSESFSVNAGANMLSVSNTYLDVLVPATGVPTLSQWALAATALLLLAVGSLGLRASSQESRPGARMGQELRT
jgi:hypothetical protein